MFKLTKVKTSNAHSMDIVGHSVTGNLHIFKENDSVEDPKLSIDNVNVGDNILVYAGISFFISPSTIKSITRVSDTKLYFTTINNSEYELEDFSDLQ